MHPNQEFSLAHYMEVLLSYTTNNYNHQPTLGSWLTVACHKCKSISPTQYDKLINHHAALHIITHISFGESIHGPFQISSKTLFLLHLKRVHHNQVINVTNYRSFRSLQCYQLVKICILDEKRKLLNLKSW